MIGSETPKSWARRVVEERLAAERAQEAMFMDSSSQSSVNERQLRGDAPTSSVYLSQHPGSRRRKNSLHDRFVDTHNRKYKTERDVDWDLSTNTITTTCVLPPRSFENQLVGVPAVDEIIKITDILSQQVLQVVVEASFFKYEQKMGTVTLRLVH